ncbi:MAG TPA: hypothetical protein VMU02_09790 [bacterium]|nr:hypothetical protein [bacterium]
METNRAFQGASNHRPFVLLEPARIVAAAILAALLVSCLGCGQKAVVEEAKERWVRIRHTPIKDVRAGKESAIEADISSGAAEGDLRALIFYRTGGLPFQAVEMTRLEHGKYFGYLPPQVRGAKLEYYIEARSADNVVARVPAKDKAAAFSVAVKGTPNRYLLVSHVFLIFVGLFFFLFSGYLGYKALKDRRTLLYIPRIAFLGTIIFFIASIPLGMVVAYQTHGVAWTGFPVGRDLTDNKALAILIYWIACGFLFRGSLFRKDPSRDLVSMAAMPYVHIAGALITAVLFAIPH